MGKRLTKIYTRTGDRGDTGLGDGSRVEKNHPLVEAIGTVDELNSILGLFIARLRKQDNQQLGEIAEFLCYIQHRIFDLGGELSIPELSIITSDHVRKIETALDALNDQLAPLENFILPGGSELIATAHLTRSICRRTERRMVGMPEAANENALQFINRLSDYLFVAARTCARATNTDEVLWTKE